MLEAVPNKGALAAAFAATAVLSAAAGAVGAARLARWAARLAPEAGDTPSDLAGSLPTLAPRVVVPLVNSTAGLHPQATSSHDVGGTMHHTHHLHGMHGMHGMQRAVKG